jgi:hypothetical protein
MAGLKRRNAVLVLVMAMVMVMVVLTEASPLTRLFMGSGGGSSQPSGPQGVDRALIGDWKIEKLTGVFGQDGEPKTESFNVTIRATNASIHYDLEAIENQGKAPQFKIKIEGPWSGSFLSADDPVTGQPLKKDADDAVKEEPKKKKKPVIVKTAGEASETPEFPQPQEEEEEDAEFEGNAENYDSALEKIFDFDFQRRTNDARVSYGKWLGTRSYQFVILSPNAWMLSIFDSDPKAQEPVVEFTAKRIPKADNSSWWSKLGSPQSLLVVVLLFNLAKRFFFPRGPPPGVRPQRSDGSPSSSGSNAGSSASSGSSGSSSEGSKKKD